MINIFISSLVLAIWGVTLFYGKTVGLSMLLFAIPFTYLIIYILEKNNKILNSKAKLLIIPISVLSATYCIYNNVFFNMMNISAIPLLLIFMIMELLGEKIKINFEFIGKILGILIVPISFIGESIEKLRVSIEEKFKIEIDNKKNYNIKKYIRAALITLPITIVILILLSSADQVFGSGFIKIADNIFKFFNNLKVSTVIAKLLLIIISCAYFLGFFDYITYRYEVDVLDEKKRKYKDDSSIKMILSVLNVIYLVFCIIQIKSLFLKNVSINYADYARKGFFQLMIVSVINLLTILIAKSFTKNSDKKSHYINTMAILMVVFTFIILISSAYRMYLYESAYGYTMLRLLVYCSLFTESILLIPTIIYILDKPINLTKTYFIIVTVVYVCMNLANFEKIIAKRNIDRYFETGKLDMNYLEYATGSDAVEEIVRILDIIDEEGNRTLAQRHLSELYNNLKDSKMDYRDYNFSKSKAKKIIEKNLDKINDL